MAKVGTTHAQLQGSKEFLQGIQSFIAATNQILACVQPPTGYPDSSSWPNLSQKSSERYLACHQAGDIEDEGEQEKE